MPSPVISVEELKQHAGEYDGWIAIIGVVWDISGFASEHPGGDDVIKEYLGQDGSEVYNSIHSPAMISQHVGAQKKIGRASNDGSLVTSSKAPSITAVSKPPLDLILSMNDFEEVASKALPEVSWANDWYHRNLLRSRVLQDVSRCDMSISIFGTRFPLPFFNAPASLVKMVHPDGELVLAQGAAAKGTTIMIPLMSSFTLEEIVAQLPSGHPLFFQLCVHSDRAVTEQLIRHATKLGPTAILITVDLPTFSKAKERYDAKVARACPKKGASVQKQPRSAAQSISSKLQWEDIAWLNTLAKVPIVLKGIQCAADARKALDYGCDGINLSNHGGRAFDTAPPSILTLLEIQAECPEVLEKMEVFIDGGIRRGTDIFKALCLGASAVCLERPFLYAVNYGQEGVEHAIQILSEELESAMTLSGITSLSQARPGLLNTTAPESYMCRGTGHPWAKKIIRNKL